MSELDQAAAGSGHDTAAATDVAEPDPVDQRPSSYDSRAGHPRGTSASDIDPGYYDGDISADNVPTRQEAARQDAAGEGRDDPGRDHSQDDDADIQAILHEDDDLPDPRTRQQAAREDAAHGAAERDAAEAGEQPRSGPDPLADAASEKAASRDAPITVVQADPADRTLGDTTPIGIGLKPSGEQLLRMENDSESPLEKLRRAIYDRADDINDAGDEYGGDLEKLFERPPAAAAHAEVQSNPQDAPHHEHQGIDGGHLATSGFVLGVVGYEVFRRVKHGIETWRQR